MMRNDRFEWQNKFALFRNEHLEHQRPVDPELIASFYRLDSAEVMFENVWEAIEDITVQLLVPQLATGAELIEIPLAERDATVPRRFGLHVAGLPANRN